MHTDSTIGVVRVFFRIFATSLRRFSNVTCTAYQTTELPKEAKARLQRQQQRGPQREGGAPAASSSATASTTVAAPGKGAPRRKEFSMNTYKLHSLGDYPDCIVSVGTMDSHSTQIVSPCRYLHTAGFLQDLMALIFRESWLIALPNDDTLVQARKSSSSN